MLPQQWFARATGGVREECQSQYIAKRVDYFRGGSADTSTIAADAIRVFEEKWSTVVTRVEVVPGKSTLAALREKVQDYYSVGLTDHRIISAFEDDEVPRDLRDLLGGIENFRLRD